MDATHPSSASYGWMRRPPLHLVVGGQSSRHHWGMRLNNARIHHVSVPLVRAAILMSSLW